MLDVYINETRVVKLTHQAQALGEVLEDSNSPPLVTDYQLFLIFKNLHQYQAGASLRKSRRTLGSYRRSRNLLIKANKLAKDWPSYPKAFRVLSKQDLPADEVCCLVDPFCYISHLSAMQRYGLTDRRPEALHITAPIAKNQSALIKEKMSLDYGPEIEELPEDEVLKLTMTHHPDVLRKRKVHVNSTKYIGEHIQVKGSFARISTIGQTFLDMLEEPELCGGMAHVIEVWSNHANSYLDEIIRVLDQAPKDVHKVRAGYILEELLHVSRADVNEWAKFAQRGGSRVLDPSKPFINTYSAKWMLSINV